MELALELKNLSNMKVTIYTNCNCFLLVQSTKGLVQEMEDLQITRRILEPWGDLLSLSLKIQSNTIN